MLLVAALGSAIGSFLNVVIYRLPLGRSLLWPASACPHCGHRLRPWENVPILGWLRLRGRCSQCGAAIALRYPLVEATTALWFVAVYAYYGWDWATPGYWLLGSWLFALAWIDRDTLTLPNPLTQSGLVLGLAFQMGIGLGSGHPAQGLMNGVGAAVLGLWLVELIIWLGSLALGQTAMGGGDAKLAAMLGAWLGWQKLLLTGFMACAVGAGVGLGAIALGRLHRRQPMPFGPFLALGALLSVLWGDRLIQWYLHAFFPSM